MGTQEDINLTSQWNQLYKVDVSLRKPSLFGKSIRKGYNDISIQDWEAYQGWYSGNRGNR